VTAQRNKMHDRLHSLEESGDEGSRRMLGVRGSVRVMYKDKDKVRT